MAVAACSTDFTRDSACRDGHAAAHLKFISIFLIFFTSVIGVSLPVLLTRFFHGKPLYDKAILIIKCFAAGVILSTSLVHVLPDAFDALSDCQVASQHPWRDFPFCGLVTMIGALLALLVDVTATSHVEHSHYNPVETEEKPRTDSAGDIGLLVSVDSKSEMGNLGGGSCHRRREGEEELVKLKQKLVSQVLEIGIIFHSVIIGVTMGMSQNQCTIKPLVAALSFHQIFEGMGLGGCIAQVIN